ncbi:hypothetical protein GJS30_03740 [Bacillus velezensis]|uniref:hypothetical protein n=1 Tax=Bacillus velezensis TaxID=492670 RepID=UPI0015C47D93|nr:hypothetical protein [Bacillus velezensis]QLG06248.1 hypothetical protein GJS30_03740 [Bacillus velezensis]
MKNGSVIHTIIPGFITILTYFLPNLDYPYKFFPPLIILALYFIFLCIVLQRKLDNNAKKIKGLEEENKGSKERIKNYENFVHKRELFIKHDLVNISKLISDHETYIRDSKRGKAHEELRREAKLVKENTIKIVDQEKRDFDEQLFSISGNKNHR